MAEILSQEEIDALLEAIEDEIADDPTSISPERFAETMKEQEPDKYLYEDLKGNLKVGLWEDIPKGCWYAFMSKK